MVMIWSGETEPCIKAAAQHLEVARSGRRGGVSVGAVVTTMTAISSGSKRMGGIVAVTDGIAFQTSILAVSTSVEAARAGEQYSGFALAASEDRTLADRSADVANEIRNQSLASVARADQGAQLIDRADTALHRSFESIKLVAEVAGALSNASIEQSKGVGQVGQTITYFDQAPRIKAALVEQSAAAAASLSKQAHELVDTVSIFKASRTASARAFGPSRQPLLHSAGDPALG